MMKKILFVCQGNICRSPIAEAVFLAKIKAAGLVGYTADSAGTIGYHAGELPDARMRAHASRRGYVMQHHARRITTRDFETFDMILTMDDANYDDVRAMAPDLDAVAKVQKMVRYCRRKVVDCVPDPYYGGASGFENVIDILEDACDGLVEKLQSQTAD